MATKTIIKTYNTEEWSLMNKQTGELAEESGCDYSEIKVKEFTMLPESQNDAIDINSNVTFYKSFVGNGKLLYSELKPIEIATLVLLCDFICYKDCVLRVGGHKNGRALSIAEIAEYCELEYETLRRTMSKLKSKQIIGYHNTGDKHNGNVIKWITVNPYLFMRGNKVERWVAEFYADTVWAKVNRIYAQDTFDNHKI